MSALNTTLKFDKIVLCSNIGAKKIFLPFWMEEGFPADLLDRGEKQAPALFSTLKRFTGENTFGGMDCQGFVDAVNADNTLWEEAVTPEGKEIPYIRYRIGKLPWKDGSRTWSIYGVWVFYETNWGDQHRGYAVNRDNNGKQRPVTQEDYDKVKTEQSSFKQKTPYISDNGAYFKPNGLTPAKTISNFLVNYTQNGQKVPFIKILLEVMWSEVSLNEALAVDLIVDLGNTRTVALLMEPESKIIRDLSLDQFSAKCRPVVLDLTDEEKYIPQQPDFSNAVIDSWFLLCKPQVPVPVFEDWDIQEKAVSYGLFGRKKKYVKELQNIVLRKSSSFAQVSPVVSGNEAKTMYSGELAVQYTEAITETFQQSSPKRYYWYNEQWNTGWKMLLRKSDPNYQEALANTAAVHQKLAGDILYFMPNDGHIMENTRTVDLRTCLEADNNPELPRHPVASSVTWFLVHILEKAWDQLIDINNSADRVHPKYLARVLGTYPSGWTSAEIDMYRKRWQQALDIFYRTHFDGINDEEHPYVQLQHQRKPEIELNINLDEAVAGQMPFIVSEINEASKNVKFWMDITGKDSAENTKATRVMNIDIGGGTSDIAVIEYSVLKDAPLGQAGLTCKLLSKECFTVAGDEIVKDIIIKMLLPQLQTSSVYKLSDPLIKDEKKPEFRKRVRAVRGCLIPVVNAILNKIKREPEGLVSTKEANCSKKNLDTLRELIGDTTQSDSLEFEYRTKSDGKNIGVEEIVRKRFGHMLTRCACYAYMYDVDYIFISGKPSELPAVRDMIEHYTGLPLDRIISAKNYLVGSWYPFSSRDNQTDVSGTMKISDAKSVTAVGCALYNALNEQRIQGWRVTMPSSHSIMKNRWSVLTADTVPVREIYGGELFDNQQDNMASFKPLETIAYIGRRLSPLFDYEPVYKFCPKNPDTNKKYPNGVKVKFKRSSAEDTLELVAVQAPNGSDVTHEFELKIWPCVRAEYRFWQDNGLLEKGGDDEE